MPKGSWSSQNAGSSSAQLPGSIAAGALPKILRISTAMHWLSFDWPPSDLCCENSVILDKLLGQTLRGRRSDALASSGGAPLPGWPIAPPERLRWYASLVYPARDSAAERRPYTARM